MGCAVTYFLNVGAYVGSGAVTATNLKKGNKKKKRKIFVLFLEGKYGGMP